jgi:hypothetical protein
MRSPRSFKHSRSASLGTNPLAAEQAKWSPHALSGPLDRSFRHSVPMRRRGTRQNRLSHSLASRQGHLFVPRTSLQPANGQVTQQPGRLPYSPHDAAQTDATLRRAVEDGPATAEAQPPGQHRAVRESGKGSTGRRRNGTVHVKGGVGGECRVITREAGEIAEGTEGIGQGSRSRVRAPSGRIGESPLTL